MFLCASILLGGHFFLRWKSVQLATAFGALRGASMCDALIWQKARLVSAQDAPSLILTNG